jgi:hypothetical protein
LIKVLTVATSLLLVGWFQQVFFLPVFLFTWFLVFRVFRNSGSLGVLKKFSFGLLVIAIFYLSLNLLTLDLRRTGDRFHATGAHSLTVGQVSTAYFTTVGMGIGGFFIGAPYAAMENLRLLVPNSGELTIEDDFPSKSQKVRQLLNNAKQRNVGIHRTPLVWGSYCEDHCDVAYALNGGNLSIDIKGKKCIATASAEVEYKPEFRSSTLAVLPLLRLRIDQAAIHAVQELGYLFPYNIYYRWTC